MKQFLGSHKIIFRACDSHIVASHKLLEYYDILLVSEGYD